MIAATDLGLTLDLQPSSCSKSSNRRPSFSDGMRVIGRKIRDSCKAVTFNLGRMKKNSLSDSQSIRTFRKFLDEIDTTKDGWREKVVDFVLDEFCCPELGGEKTDCERKESTSKIFFLGQDSDTESGPSTPTQDGSADFTEEAQIAPAPTPDRKIEDLAKDLKEEKPLRDGDYLRLLNRNFLKLRELEEKVKEKDRAVSIRREFVAPKLLTDVPFKGYDYDMVMNSCCENVVGYMPLPLGVAGPLKINNRTVWVPMATTEGALVASTNRGCSAIFKSGGVTSRVTDDKMTRAPVVQMESLDECLRLDSWIQREENFKLIKKEFERTSNYACLKKVETTVDGRHLFIKFFATTGDAMGMNMVSKGCASAMKFLKSQFPEMQVQALSGNLCVDKKPAAINWIQGRGKSVSAECRLSDKIVSAVLRTTPAKMVEAANAKLNIGSARAGSIGGQNCHAANIVAAIFLATGQDAAQVVSSSMCSTQMDVTEDGELRVSCTMPVMEVGTVGGGTILKPQRNCLKMLGCAGPNEDEPGANAKRLAEMICGTVLAGELSLLASLTTDDLVDSHMKLNRSRMNLYSSPAQLGQPGTLDEQRKSLLLTPSAHPIRQKRNSESRPPGCANIL